MRKTRLLICFLLILSLASCSRSNWDISSLRVNTPALQSGDDNIIDDLDRCIQQFALDTVGNLDAQERTLEVIIINDSPINFDRPKVNVIGGLEIADSPLAIHAGGRASFAFQRVNSTENTSRNIFSIQLGWEYSQQESYPLSLDFCGSDTSPLWFRTRSGDFNDLQNEYNGWDNLPSGEFDVFKGENLKIDHQFESFLGNWPRRLTIRISQKTSPWQSMRAVTFQVPNSFVYWSSSLQQFQQTTDITDRNISWAFKQVFEDVYTLTKLGDDANQVLSLNSSNVTQFIFVNDDSSQDPSKRNLLTFWRIKINEINTQQVTIQNFKTKQFITHQCQPNSPLKMESYGSSETKKCIYFEITAINNYIPFNAPTNRYYYLQNLAGKYIRLLTSSLEHLRPPAFPTQQGFADSEDDAKLWFLHPVKWVPASTNVEESGYIIMNKGSGQVLSTVYERILVSQAMNSTASTDAIFRRQMWQITQDPVYSHRLKIRNMQYTKSFLTPNASGAKGLGWNITFLTNEQIAAGLTPIVGLRNPENGLPFDNNIESGGAKYLARLYPQDMILGVRLNQAIVVQVTKTEERKTFRWMIRPSERGTYRFEYYGGGPFNGYLYYRAANDPQMNVIIQGDYNEYSEWKVEPASEFGNIGYRFQNVASKLYLTQRTSLSEDLPLFMAALDVDSYTQVFRLLDYII